MFSIVSVCQAPAADLRGSRLPCATAREVYRFASKQDKWQPQRLPLVAAIHNLVRALLATALRARPMMRRPPIA